MGLLWSHALDAGTLMVVLPWALFLLGVRVNILEKRVSEGEFREDLYYRLAVFPIELPPLRNRREDIPDLCLHFLSQKRTKEGKGPSGLTAPAMDALGAHDWPGNIRELQNEVERKRIAAALERHNGNRTHACEELQVSRWWLGAGGWGLVAEDQDLRTRQLNT